MSSRQIMQLICCMIEFFSDIYHIIAICMIKQFVQIIFLQREEKLLRGNDNDRICNGVVSLYRFRPGEN